MVIWFVIIGLDEEKRRESLNKKGINDERLLKKELKKSVDILRTEER